MTHDALWLLEGIPGQVAEIGDMLVTLYDTSLLLLFCYLGLTFWIYFTFHHICSFVVVVVAFFQSLPGYIFVSLSLGTPF